MIRISVYHGEALCCTKEADMEVFHVYREAWQEGDRIVIEAGSYPAYLAIRLDDTLGEAKVYLTGPMTYEIPFGEPALRFSEQAFKGTLHYLYARLLEDKETENYGDLMCNPYDQHDTDTCFPHMTANAETRGESVFFAANVSNGIIANDSHGEFPYASWGIDSKDDAEITVHFGRPVNAEKLVIYLRADFPHDNWWPEITVWTSDGDEKTYPMQKTGEGQVICLDKKELTWLKMGRLVMSDEPALWPALSGMKIYGTNA